MARPKKGTSLEDRFWSAVDRSRGGCWNWKRRTWKGYGAIKIGSKAYGAHRVAYMLVRGPIPDGMFVCHKCDNPACVRPSHLFLGTALDNIADRHAKGRTSRVSRNRGESHPSARLTWSAVNEIRTARGTQKEIADRFGVTRQTVGKIINGEMWRE